MNKTLSFYKRKEAKKIDVALTSVDKPLKKALPKCHCVDKPLKKALPKCHCVEVALLNIIGQKNRYI